MTSSDDFEMIFTRIPEYIIMVHVMRTQNSVMKYFYENKIIILNYPHRPIDHPCMMSIVILKMNIRITNNFHKKRYIL